MWKHLIHTCIFSFSNYPMSSPECTYWCTTRKNLIKVALSTCQYAKTCQVLGKTYLSNWLLSNHFIMLDTFKVSQWVPMSRDRCLTVCLVIYEKQLLHVLCKFLSCLLFEASERFCGYHQLKGITVIGHIH